MHIHLSFLDLKEHKYKKQMQTPSMQAFFNIYSLFTFVQLTISYVRLLHDQQSTKMLSSTNLTQVKTIAVLANVSTFALVRVHFNTNVFATAVSI